MASRLPLRHRAAVLAAVLVFSAGVLVWGYVLNVGTLRVATLPGDLVEVDGDEHPGSGEVRAGERRVRVTREHYAPFVETVRVRRGQETAVTPALVFVPYVSMTADVPATIVPQGQRGEAYRETPGRLSSYTGTLEGGKPVALPAELRAARATFSPAWKHVWLALDDGTELVRFLDGTTWRGSSTGRTFAADDTFIAAFTKGEGTEVARYDAERRAFTPLGVVDGQGTYTLVASGTPDTVLAISDETGVATVLRPSGRTKLELEHAVLDARWSADGTKLLLQVRLPGASMAARLAVYDLASSSERLLDVRAPIALADFTADGSVIALERIATAESSRDEVQRQLEDARARKLAEDVQKKILPFVDFQDALPAELRTRATLVLLDAAEGARSELVVNGVELTSETVRIEAEEEEGTVLALLPGQIVTIRFAEKKPGSVAAPSAHP